MDLVIENEYILGPVCCRAMIAQCLSCTAGQTLSEYCVINPATVGCPTRDGK